jgi:flagellar motor switch protein FliN
MIWMADMLTQDEINALLGGNSSLSGADEYYEAIEDVLSDMEKDAIGEIGNINMGTAATTLFTLLNQKVTITTPNIEEMTLKKLAGDFNTPCVIIVIRYKLGISGLNLLILKEQDVKIITDLMMGGDGIDVTGELTELHLSAINEAMNQMIGSSSTSLSEMLKTKIDISPPESIYTDIADLDLESLGIDLDEHFVRISFKITVGDLIDSEIMQLIPVEVAQQMIKSIMPQSGLEPEMDAVAEAGIGSSELSQDDIDKLLSGGFGESSVPASSDTVIPAQGQVFGQATEASGAGQHPGYGQQGGYFQPGHAPYGEQQGFAPHQGGYQQTGHHAQPVNAMPFQFDSFDAPHQPYVHSNAEIELIKDVPLEITVELGRTKRKISDILDFGMGTVVELDKIVGESLDILANGKKIARGEVVVVDENYGIRITEINTQEKKA